MISVAQTLHPQANTRQNAKHAKQEHSAKWLVSNPDPTWSIWVCLLMASRKAAARSLIGAAGSSRSNSMQSSLGGPFILHTGPCLLYVPVRCPLSFFVIHKFSQKHVGAAPLAIDCKVIFLIKSQSTWPAPLFHFLVKSGFLQLLLLAGMPSTCQGTCSGLQLFGIWCFS